VACADEHAFLMQLAGSGVTIFGLNYKDDSDAAQRWLAEKGDPYRINILDADGRLGLDLGVTGAPETYVIDADGVVRLRHQGVVDAQVWRTQLEPLLRAQMPEPLP
jgi:cytochrome c biogenesis protein CcmG, thiol:disulfide interchange protein DsbE